MRGKECVLQLGLRFFRAERVNVRVPQVVVNADGMAVMQLEGEVRRGAVRSAYASCVPAGLMVLPGRPLRP